MSEFASAMHGVRYAEAAAAWRTLHKSNGLRFEADRCLPMRHRGAGCDDCVQICPAQAITFADTGLDVADVCTGCGRCVAACPMGALAIDGFAGVDSAQGVADSLVVECWRVPVGERVANAVAVPCLGGIDAAWLIERQRTGGGVQLVDRGWCAACPSGGCEEPARRALDEARDLLETMGVPPSRLPRIHKAALPVTVKPRVEERADHEIKLSRRAFFGQLARRASEAVSPLLPAQAAAAANLQLARPPRRSRARLRLLAACAELSRAQGLPMPHTLFRRAAVSGACCNRGVCAAVCPTGALLTRTSDGITQELVFSAVDCIACGACVTACPEGAARLDACNDEGWRSEAVLWRVAMRECAECGAAFIARDAQPLCDPCNKSRHLAREMYQQFFGRSAQADGPSRSTPEHETRVVINQP